MSDYILDRRDEETQIKRRRVMSVPLFLVVSSENNANLEVNE